MKSPTADDEPLELASVPPAAHRRTTGIEIWRFWATLAAVSIVFLWRVLDWILPVLPGATWHTPAPVADVHALWESKCNTCHTFATPLSATNWIGMMGGWTHAADSDCQSCHAGVDHHQKENPDQRAGCTACHREHQGREANLLRVADAECTRCHAHLGKHLAHGAATRFADVSRFDQHRDHHPDFRALSSDPGRLKFNHKLHMTPGMRLTPGGEPFTLAHIDARFRENYADAKLADATEVTLACSSCHQLDSRDFAVAPGQLDGVPLSSALPVRSPGSSLLPILYEKHCQACHPLSFERKDPDDARSGVLTIHHRLQPDEIHNHLVAHYTAMPAKNAPPASDRPEVPLPGRSPDSARPSVSQTVADQVARAERELYLSKKGCGECHHWSPDPAPLSPERLREMRVAPTEIKEVWFEQAVFNHSAHRLLECRACHARAAATDTGASTTNRDVLLPGIDKCLECHSPRATGGARHDCVECHRYHDGDHPLTGKGSSARAGLNAGTRTISEFLEGKSP